MSFVIPSLATSSTYPTVGLLATRLRAAAEQLEGIQITGFAPRLAWAAVETIELVVASMQRGAR